MSDFYTTLGSGLAGGLGNYLSYGQIASNYADAQDTLSGLQSDLTSTYDTQSSDLYDLYESYLNNSDTDTDALRSAIESLNNADYTYDDAGDLDYDLQSSIDSFMTPYLDTQINAATSEIENSAANAGNLFSSASANTIANKAAELSGDAYSDALAAAMEDRDYERSAYESDISFDRDAVDQALALASSQISGLSSLADLDASQTNAYTSANTDLSNTYNTNYANSVLSQANLQANTPSTGLGAFLSGIVSAIGG